jgi:hypothetical protein
MQQTEWQQQANPERQAVVTAVLFQVTLEFLLLTTEAPIRPEHAWGFVYSRANSASSMCPEAGRGGMESSLVSYFPPRQACLRQNMHCDMNDMARRTCWCAALHLLPAPGFDRSARLTCTALLQKSSRSRTISGRVPDEKRENLL